MLRGGHRRSWNQPNRGPCTLGPTCSLLASTDHDCGRACPLAGVCKTEAFDVSPENIEARTERTELESGLPVAFLPKKTRGESVQLRLTLRYGNLENLSGKTTACEVLPYLMMRGTQNLTRQQIQDELSKHFSRIAPSASAGELTFAVESRRSELPAVLEILRQILREATLPQEELEILRTQYLALNEKQLTDPTALAQKAISQIINPYPADDPRYVPSIAENMERWRALQHADVAALYGEYLGGANGELSIVGDFDPAEIRPLLDKTFADWTPAREYARIPKEGRIELKNRRQEIVTPDKENAVYFAATVMPVSDADPDYAELVIGADIFGGSGLSSRLGDRVRQEEGLSYGVGAFMTAQTLDERTTFGMYAITNPANILKVEEAIAQELQRLLAEGITEDELAAAQNGFLERQKIERSDDANLAVVLNNTLQAERDMSYHADLREQILALTVDEVNQVLRRQIDPKRIPLVVAGDFNKTPAGN